ncbi:MAG: LamG-like jellyroll fold domain-containing protein [Planctomycetota bacterium]
MKSHTYSALLIVVAVCLGGGGVTFGYDLQVTTLEDGLVSHWTFDEGEGSTAYDSAGDNNGTLIGDANWTSGKIGGAIILDGNGDYVDCGNDSSLNVEDITISAWINPDTIPSLATGIVFKVNSYQTNLFGGRLKWGIWSDYLFSNYDFTTHTNEWHHTVITFEKTGTNQGEAKIYIDGVLDNSGSLSQDIDPTGSNLYIGYKSDLSGAYFDGLIDDVRIYERALSDEEVWQLYWEGASEPVAHWKFDEGSGTTANDSAGSNHGTVYGATWTSGQIGGALSFDGDDDYVLVPDSDSISIGNQDCTISAWIRPNAFGFVIVSKVKDTADKEYDMKIVGDGKIHVSVEKNANNQYAETTTSPITTSIWQHVAVTFDSSTTTPVFYYNGAFQASTSKINTLPDELDDDLYIGKAGGTYTGGHIDGLIDDIRIYNRVLSAEEIEELYQGGPTYISFDIKPGTCPNPLNLKGQGVLPAAILGTEELDVSTIDVASVRLAGVAAIRHSYEDVSGRVSDSNDCNCTEDGPDGYTDLALKFRAEEIVEQLIDMQDGLAKGQTLALTLRGELYDDTTIEGSDCVVLVGNVPKWLAIKGPDINGDGEVNILDFAELANYWLQSGVIIED